MPYEHAGKGTSRIGRSQPALLAAPGRDGEGSKDAWPIRQAASLVFVARCSTSICGV